MFAKIQIANKVKSAIAIFSPNINVLKLEQFSNTYFVCIEISLRKERYYIINAYFRYCEILEPSTILDSTSIKGTAYNNYNGLKLYIVA